MEQGQVPPPQQQQPPPPAPAQGWPSWQAHPGQAHPGQPHPGQAHPGQPGPAQWGQTPYGYQPVPPYAYGQPAWPQPSMHPAVLKAPPAEHPKELPWQLAGWWPRVGAQLIDLLIVWVPASLLLVAPILAAEAARDGSGTETTWLVVSIVVTFLAIGAHLFYAPLLMRRKGKRNGQSLGKQMCGIRVIRADGEPMRFSDAALRQIIFKSFGGLVASTFVPLFPWILNYLWPTWDEQHRALHDLAADTRVVAA
jgi:uncharacterized RDD family membrane protein YckC